MTERGDPTLWKVVNDYYSDKIRTHGPTPQGVDWNSETSQVLRFAQFLRLLPEGPLSIGDVGCGYGGLFDFLEPRRQEFAYIGVDISEDMIAQALARHTGSARCEFAVSRTLPRAVDYAVASGIFNVRQHMSDDAWLRHILQCVDDLDRASSCGFAFNCLTSYSDAERKRANLYYADPAVLFDYCMKKSRHVALLHDYGLYEFTLLVRKQR